MEEKKEEEDEVEEEEVEKEEEEYVRVPHNLCSERRQCFFLFAFIILGLL